MYFILTFILLIYFYYNYKESVKYYDFEDKKVKYEYRDFITILSIFLHQIGIINKNNYIYKKIEKYLIAKFNDANIDFKSQSEAVSKITEFAKTYGIDLKNNIWDKEIYEYKNINDFFMRKYKKYDFGDLDIITPVTAVVRKYSNIKSLSKYVKGDKILLEKCGINNVSDFVNNSCYYFYLSPADYHCFHSPIDGTIEYINDFSKINYNSKSVKPDLFSSDVLIKNRRYIIEIKRGQFRLVMVIIGGFLVDSIRIKGNIKKGYNINKGEMIGSFALGGSAVLLLTNKEFHSFTNDYSCPIKFKVGNNFGLFKKDK